MNGRDYEQFEVGFRQQAENLAAMSDALKYWRQAWDTQTLIDSLGLVLLALILWRVW